MSKAIIVVGPEASGGRYLSTLIGSGGILRAHALGSPGDFDDTADDICLPWLVVPPASKEDFVTARSFPCAKRWPDLEKIIAYLRKLDYTPTILVRVRDPRVCELSQIRAGHVSSVEEARKNIALAYLSIFKGLQVTRVSYAAVPYGNEARQATRLWLQQYLGLPRTPSVYFADGDVKYGGMV